MSLRMQIYNELVNKHSGIRERYMEVHCKQTPFFEDKFLFCFIMVECSLLYIERLDIRLYKNSERK